MAITKQDVLEYHRRGRPGKIEVRATKPLVTQQDLSLAYSPGVAEAVLEIDRDSMAGWELTARANLVAVITNGSAILGLGNLGPLPAKAVMEGKGVLFKRFADIDVFDIELDTDDPRNSSPSARPSRPPSAASTLRTSRRPRPSRSRRASRPNWTSPCFTMTSTAPPSLPARPAQRRRAGGQVAARHARGDLRRGRQRHRLR